MQYFQSQCTLFKAGLITRSQRIKELRRSLVTKAVSQAMQLQFVDPATVAICDRLYNEHRDGLELRIGFTLADVTKYVGLSCSAY